MVKILIIEDDYDIASIEKDYIETAGFKADVAFDGETGLKKALEENYDLVLLDIMLPKIDGFTILRELRKEKDIPILMVTAKREDIDKIRGLGMGADDYVEKPFSPSVLLARIKAHLDRYSRLKGSEIKSEINISGIRLNTETRRVYVDGKEVELKNKEYELLLFLMLNLDHVFSREELYENIWGMDKAGDNTTVVVHINRLREKIERDPSNPERIETVWGAGYRFKP